MSKQPAEKIKPVGLNPYVTKMLECMGKSKTRLNLLKNAKIFTQGDVTESIYFIQSGKIKITAVASGQDVALATLGERDFFGEGCLVGQSLRVSTATAIQPSVVFEVSRKAMIIALRDQPELAEKFTASLLTRNIDLEKSLCDQLFNHSEKRLARALLKLARLHKHDALHDAPIPALSYKTLSEMVGTTPARITHFMNKFKNLGLIEGDAELTVKAELLVDVVLHD